VDADISVVIPTYNRGNETIRAVKSAIRQTVSLREIIVVDDGSDTQNIKFLKENFLKIGSDKVVFLEIEHTGHPGAVRNVGVAAAQGEWVAFLDSDDEWTPEKIEYQLIHMKDSGAKASAQCIRSLKNSNKWSEVNRSKLKKENLFICSSVLLKKSVLVEVGGFPETTYSVGVEDYVTWLKVSTMINWEMSLAPHVIYNIDNSTNLSKSLRTQNRYSKAVALLIFSDWELTRNKKNKILLRLLLKILGVVV
jgi:glycosyltransferase involved in cell wall biosynthesis